MTESRPTHETHFTVKCPSCDQRYLVPRGSGKDKVGMVAFLARGPRCTQPRDVTGGVCGTPLAASQAYTASRGGREPIFVERPQSLLGWVVVRDVVYTDLATRAARVMVLDRRIAGLQDELTQLKCTDLYQEVARLKQRYETPCRGMVKSYGPKDVLGHLVQCGGFLGHPGDCAEVW